MSSNNENLILLRDQFKLLSSLAESEVVIKADGKPKSFKKIVFQECKSAEKFIGKVLDGDSTSSAMAYARKAVLNGDLADE